MVLKENRLLSGGQKRLMVKKLFQYLIRVYTFLISPLLGNNCRFHPTCSAYAHQALEKHGVLKGLYLAITRIFSCHPYSKRKFLDPVPSTFAWKDILGYKRSIINQDDKTK